MTVALFVSAFLFWGLTAVFYRRRKGAIAKASLTIAPSNIAYDTAWKEILQETTGDEGYAGRQANQLVRLIELGADGWQSGTFAPSTMSHREYSLSPSSSLCQPHDDLGELYQYS